MSKERLIVLSLGGSLISKDSGLDVGFLKKFRQFVLNQVKNGHRFIIVVGGGKTCRRYQQAARSVTKLADIDVDWLGIKATHLNASLIKTIFGKLTYPEVITDPSKKVNFRQKILIGAGWKPGWSTDFDAVKIAEVYNADLVINLSNVDYVYDKDPKKFKDAKKFETLSWSDFKKIVGGKWTPGANLPFDPIASKLAAKLKLQVVIMNGDKLEEINKLLCGKKFVGTSIF